MDATHDGGAASRKGVSAEALRRRLCLALRAYGRWRCAPYAAAAAACIERLLAHPDVRLTPDERCLARGLAHHYRTQAWYQRR